MLAQLLSAKSINKQATFLHILASISIKFDCLASLSHHHSLPRTKPFTYRPLLHVITQPPVQENNPPFRLYQSLVTPAPSPSSNASESPGRGQRCARGAHQSAALHPTNGRRAIGHRHDPAAARRVRPACSGRGTHPLGR